MSEQGRVCPTCGRPYEQTARESTAPTNASTERPQYIGNPSVDVSWQATMSTGKPAVALSESGQEPASTRNDPFTTNPELKEFEPFQEKSSTVQPAVPIPGNPRSPTTDNRTEPQASTARMTPQDAVTAKAYYEAFQRRQRLGRPAPPKPFAFKGPTTTDDTKRSDDTIVEPAPAQTVEPAPQKRLSPTMNVPYRSQMPGRISEAVNPEEPNTADNSVEPEAERSYMTPQEAVTAKAYHRAAERRQRLGSPAPPKPFTFEGSQSPTESNDSGDVPAMDVSPVDRPEPTSSRAPSQERKTTEQQTAQRTGDDEMLKAIQKIVDGITKIPDKLDEQSKLLAEIKQGLANVGSLE